MSNRSHRRKILLPKVILAEITAAKKQVGNLYYEFKARVITEKPDQMKLRQMIEDVMQVVSDKCTSELAKLAYLRGFSIMLKRVGGPIKSADDLYDEAMGNSKAKDGPSDASIKQAMEMLGMSAPPDGDAAGAASDTSSPSPLAGASDETPARPRFRRSYPTIPPAE